MSHCIRCNEPLPETTFYCPRCGASQKGSLPVLLIVMCALTIVGSVGSMMRSILYTAIETSVDDTHEMIPGWIFLLTGVGTMAGAIMMLMRKKTGLYAYSVFQVLYIGAVLSTIFAVEGKAGSDIPNELTFAISMSFLIPSMVFLGVYWLPMCRKSLA